MWIFPYRMLSLFQQFTLAHLTGRSPEGAVGEGAPEGVVGFSINLFIMKTYNLSSRNLFVMLTGVVLTCLLSFQPSKAEPIQGYKKIFMRQHCKLNPEYVCSLEPPIIIIKV